MSISTVRFLVLDYQGDCLNGRPLRARQRAAQFLAGLDNAERTRLARRMAWLALQRERPGVDLHMLNLRDEHGTVTAAILDELRAIAGGDWPATRWFARTSPSDRSPEATERTAGLSDRGLVSGVRSQPIRA